VFHERCKFENAAESRTRWSFTNEFKRDAVRPVTTSWYSLAASVMSLGIGEVWNN
jgi:hypothetical protein